ncbi:MAG: LemA family protein [Anaerovoracaceae bacterium]|jgi:LemA protein|nr:LemA family protein [Anaerovoracaceae bacterium]
MYYIPGILVIIGFLVFWIIKTQSNLVGLEDNNTKAMSQIGVHISSQWEVLNSLLTITREHSTQGHEDIAEIMAARHCITKESLPEDIRMQEGLIAQGLDKIKGVAEASPELKAQQDYINAIDAIHQYENMMDTSKLIYDESAWHFNNKIRKFPTVLIARALGFSARDYFHDDK